MVASETRKKLGANARCVALAISVLSCCVSSHAGNLIDWKLYSDCPRSAVENVLQCGAYGDFYLDGTSPAGCQSDAEGSETPPDYFELPDVGSFPSQPVEARSSRLLSGKPSNSVRVGSNHFLTQPISVPTLHATEPTIFLAVIDFFGDHGNSVEWLTHTVAGEFPGAKFLLDDPLVPQASVTDFSVLTQLCNLADRIEWADHVRPVVNMSFGRKYREDSAPLDPTDGTSCNETTLSCQIQRVIEHLSSSHDAVFVAAAGKQRQKMFPASLNKVVSAATLNPSIYFEFNRSRATWEMPLGADALMPGSSLCLRGGWPAPAGASYASAVAAGWLAQVLAENPRLNVHEPGIWEPQESSEYSCTVLAKNGQEYSQCNSYAQELMNGLGGNFMHNCWNDQGGEVLQAHVQSQPNSQPLFASAVEWLPGSRPSPEGDPCVPCTGGNIVFQAANSTKSSPDFSINFSRSEAFNNELAIDAVYLRTDNQFNLIELSRTQLALIGDGLVNRLDLSGAGVLIERSNSASLYFVLRDESVDTCSDVDGPSDVCAWISTHIHIP